MVTALSLSSSSSAPQKKEEPPKAGLASRTSFHFNATQAAAIVMIVGLVSLPWAVAALTPSQSNPSSQIQLNGTCIPLVISPLALAAYLRSGFIRAAPLSDHPAAQAMALHKAKNKLRYGDEDWTKEQEQSLRLKEAAACQEAGELAESPEEKLAWVARGLKELKFFPSDAVKKRFGSNEDQLSTCDVAISLFSTQAQALLSISSPTQAPFQGTRYDAAQAFHNPAHCSQMLGRYKESIDFQQKAIQALKEIDTASYPLKERIALQEEIVRTSTASLNIATWNSNSSQELISNCQHVAFNETMNLQEQYQQLITESPADKISSTINRALRLEDAAYFTANLTQKVELLRTARDAVQKIWNHHQDDCLKIENFRQPAMQRQRASIYSASSFSLEHSLLGRLQSETQEAERQLLQQNQPLQKVLVAAWNTFRSWMKK
jgi:hypothetical protein